MSDDEMDAILLAKGREQYGTSRLCAHDSATLVQHIDDEYGWFACYQCDHCGAITRRDVTPDELSKANDAPWLDVDMYQHRTTEHVNGEVQGRALAFLGKAAR